MVTKSELTRVADNIRILSAAMVEKAKSGHPGGAMGGADFMAVLYTEFLRYDPDQMDYPFRDRFFLDPGHMSPMLYSVLSLAGYYTTEDLQSLRQWGSVTPGHPEVDVLRGVEMFRNPQVNIPLAGIVENMAWFTPEELPENRYYLFGKGGARRFAEENGIDLLGEIPIIQSIMEGADTGTPSVSIDARVEPYYREIADRIVDKVVK